MAVPVARVHLKVAHAALPALLPTPPVWKKMLPLVPTPCAAAVLPKPPPAKAKLPGRADSVERWEWDAHKAKSPVFPASADASADSVRSSVAGHGSPRKNATSPPPARPGRADSAERWDTHKKAAIQQASSSSSSSGSGTSSLVTSTSTIRSRASSGERWDVHKKRCCPPQAELLDDGDGESSSNGSSDGDDGMEEEEEIVWKPRVMYAGPGFAAAAPQPGMLPVPTAFLVPVA